MIQKTLLAVTVMTMAGLASMATAVEPLAKDIDWSSDLNAARAKSLESDRPMLLVFGAEWCTYCKKLEKTTLSHPQMVKYINERFVPVHIDYDDQKRVAKILEVEHLPCSVVLSPEADLLGKFAGYKSTTKYFQALSDAERLQDKIRQASSDAAVAR